MLEYQAMVCCLRVVLAWSFDRLIYNIIKLIQPNPLTVLEHTVKAPPFAPSGNFEHLLFSTRFAYIKTCPTEKEKGMEV